MPLDKLGKEYAAMLYQKRAEAIHENQKHELQKIVEDFGNRNMMQSGMYLSARAKVMGKHVGLMAEAIALSQSQAYEKAGLSFNQTTLDEINTEVRQFCEAQKLHLQRAAQNMVSQSFPGTAQNTPQNLAKALSQEMETALGRAADRVMRDLSIKHHEILLEQGRAALKGYAAAMGKHWDVFISHASEDKENFVRPLAGALEQSGLHVWFDATALTVGDSLRGKIDEGLSRSRYGIVVLSPDFFAKPWPQQELDGLMSKEVSGIKVILPVWHNIGFEGVQARSPILAGRLAAKSSDGMKQVVGELRAAMGL
jgi:hypothetical protein